MRILELQKTIADLLRADEELLQGGCEVFEEDTRTVYDEARQCIQEGKVAVVVMTPNLERSGSGVPAEAGLPFEGDVVVRCLENPPVAAAQGSTMRALDAAEIVAHVLDGEVLEWRSIRQTSDRREAIFTATVTFGLNSTLTRTALTTQPPNHLTT